MSVPFNPGEDLARVADGLETVTVVRPSSSVSTLVAHALRSIVRTGQPDDTAGQFTASDVAWHLPVAELPERPGPGDIIIDAADQRWNVLRVETASLATRWRCVARNLAIVHSLDSYVDIEVATLAKSESGAEVRTWHTWKTGISARIQPETTDVRNDDDRQVTRGRFTIFIAQNLVLDRRHRVRGPDRTVYQIVAVRKAERVDALMEIDVVRTS